MAAADGRGPGDGRPGDGGPGDGGPGEGGHEWDGITELDNPLPRWWLWTFWATVVWSVGYWVAMPAWPLLDGYTRGVLGYSQRAVLARQVEDARGSQARHTGRIAALSMEEIRADPELLSFALAGGRSAFSVNCSPCHGSGAQGSVGYPNLNDDDWIWGGTLEQIAFTIRHGIRNGGDDARVSDMPAYARDEILSPSEIDDVVRHVLALGRGGSGPGAGAGIFAEHCATCHGEGGKGNIELGAPDLTDVIWLYGGDPRSIRDVVSNSRGGVMPGWAGRLPPEVIKKLAIYVHALGGGR